MSFGMYAASVPAFLKAEAFAAERDIEPEVVLNWRLAPDMFPLVRQIQIGLISPRARPLGSPARRSRNMPTRSRLSPS
jgi:hypothetical protein